MLVGLVVAPLNGMRGDMRKWSVETLPNFSKSSEGSVLTANFTLDDSPNEFDGLQVRMMWKCEDNFVTLGLGHLADDRPHVCVDVMGHHVPQNGPGLTGLVGDAIFLTDSLPYGLL